MSIYPREEMPEEYAVFVITKPRVKAVPFLSKNKALIAGILRAEPNWKSLSEKEVEEATSRWLTYFRSNLMVVDWSSAFILEPFANYEDFLTTIELANMQLLELRTYDKLIEQRVEKVEADLEHAIHGFPLFPPFGRLSADIADMRNELTRYIEDTINITKFFGDYTLAKLYDLLEQRLHIQEWYASVSKKLSALEDMSKMAGSRFEARRANLLEALIVVLIIFEIYLAMRGIL
jgi:hypothetical protein